MFFVALHATARTRCRRIIKNSACKRTFSIARCEARLLASRRFSCLHRRLCVMPGCAGVPPPLCPLPRPWRRRFIGACRACETNAGPPLRPSASLGIVHDRKTKLIEGGCLRRRLPPALRPHPAVPLLHVTPRSYRYTCCTNYSSVSARYDEAISERKVRLRYKRYFVKNGHNFFAMCCDGDHETFPIKRYKRNDLDMTGFTEVYGKHLL